MDNLDMHQIQAYRNRQAKISESIFDISTIIDILNENGDDRYIKEINDLRNIANILYCKLDNEEKDAIELYFEEGELCSFSHENHNI